MISLRHKYPVFAYGKYDILLADDQNIYAYQRQGEENNLLILLNFSRDEAHFDLSAELEIEEAELILNNYQKYAELDLNSNLRK